MTDPDGNDPGAGPAPAGSPAALPPLDEAGETLWQSALAAWAETERHDRFIGHCYATTGLTAAAARYRVRLGAHPDDEVGRKMLARVAFLASQALRPSAPARVPLTRSPLFLVVIAVAAVAGAIFGLLYRPRR